MANTFSTAQNDSETDSMPRVFIPSLLRDLTEGVAEVDVEAASVREVVDVLESRWPGIRDRLCQRNILRPGLTVAVNGNVSSLGLRAKTSPESEVHFLPGIGGG